MMPRGRDEEKGRKDGGKEGKYDVEVCWVDGRIDVKRRKEGRKEGRKEEREEVEDLEQRRK